MKNLLITLICLAGLTGCGLAQGLTETCGGDLDHFCDFVLGEDPSETQDQIDEINEDVTDLQQQVVLLTQLITDKELTDDFYRQILEDLEDKLKTATGDQLTSIQNQIDNVLIQVGANENTIQNLIARVVSLEVGISIGNIQVIDPCGDYKGIDEVLLKLPNGKIIAWAKNEGLAVLSNGFYETTDKQKCKFQVLNGVVISLGGKK